MWNNRRAVLVLSLLGSPLVGCGTTGPSTGFVDHTDPDAGGQVQGRALTADGQPLAHAAVYLTPDPGARASQVATTDAQGRFQFQTHALGHDWLAINDAHGMGTVDQATLYGAGTNDLGDMRVGPLGEVPLIVSLRGVGFEERLSQSRGDLLFPAVSEDGRSVAAARLPSGSSTYDLVAIDTATGVETLLATDVQLNTAVDAPVQLLGGRAVLYRTTTFHENFGTDRVALSSQWTVLDVLDGHTLYASGGPNAGVSGGFEAAGGSLYALESTDRVVTGGTNHNAIYSYKLRPMRLDLATGETTYGPEFDFGFASSVQVLTDGKRFVVTPGHACTWSTCPASAPSWDNTEVYEVVFPDLSPRHVATVAHGQEQAFQFLSPDGASAYGNLSFGLPTGYRRSVLRLDLATGTTTELFGADGRNTGSFVYSQISGLALSPDGAELAVQLDQQVGTTGGTTTTVVRVPAAGGTAVPVPLDVQGTDICPNCTLSYANATTLRIAQIIRTSPMPEVARFVDFPTGGQMTLRTLPVGPPYVLPKLVTSPDGLQDWALIRDDAGFLQLFTGPTSAPLGALAQQTFLPADHSLPTVSADGALLRYFARDASTGYTQLFQVARPTH
jgi:hypothetical protein